MAEERKRIAAFTSGIRGYWMLRFLLDADYAHKLNYQVVGVVTDNPENRYSNSTKRGVWKYGYDPDFEPQLVPRLMQRTGIDLHYGQVRNAAFIDTFRQLWKPDLLLVNVFGQILPEEIFGFPTLGSYNFHSTAGDKWPAYQGPDPLMAIIRDGHSHCRLAMHHITIVVDGGKLHTFSRDVEIPHGAGVSDLHLMQAPLVTEVLRAELPRLLGTK